MGIQFRCFECENAFNVKDFQAGKKAKCPQCSVLLRVPNETSEYAIRVEPVGNTTPQAGEAAPAKATDSPANADNLPAQAASSPAAQDATSRIASLTGGTTAPESTLATPPPQLSTEIQRQSASDSTPPVAVASAQGQAAEAWFVNIAGSGQFGPADTATMHAWIAEGRVLPDSLVWIHPWPEWIPAAQAFPNRFVAEPSAVAHSQAAIQLQAAENPSTTPAPVNQPQQALNPQAATAISPSEVRRISKRQKRKQNYRIALIGLVVIAVILVFVLAVVLTQQG